MRQKKEVLICVAHDDDALLGVGGTIARHTHKGDAVSIVVFTDGRNSHKAVLGIEENPSPQEVKVKRREEMERASEILGVPPERLHYLDLPDGEGRVRENLKSAQKEIERICILLQPEVLYFQYPDAHADHRAAAQVVKATIEKVSSPLAAYQFFIWTKELAAGRREVDASGIPEIPSGLIRVGLAPDEQDLKRQALFAMQSQINVWPYPSWQIQPAPILEKSFLDYFLRGEELLILYNKR